jgi:hypothetical protein
MEGRPQCRPKLREGAFNVRGKMSPHKPQNQGRDRARPSIWNGVLFIARTQQMIPHRIISRFEILLWFFFADRLCPVSPQIAA